MLVQSVKFAWPCPPLSVSRIGDILNNMQWLPLRRAASLVPRGHPSRSQSILIHINSLWHGICDHIPWLPLEPAFFLGALNRPVTPPTWWRTGPWWGTRPTSSWRRSWSRTAGCPPSRGEPSTYSPWCWKPQPMRSGCLTFPDSSSTVGSLGGGLDARNRGRDTCFLEFFFNFVGFLVQSFFFYFAYPTIDFFCFSQTASPWSTNHFLLVRCLFKKDSRTRNRHRTAGTGVNYWANFHDDYGRQSTSMLLGGITNWAACRTY